MAEDLEKRIAKLEKKSEVDEGIASKLKSATVGIGLKEEGNPAPLMITGTGFIIDPEGFIMTATHVIEELERIVRNHNLQNKNKVHLSATIVHNEGNKVQILTKKLPLRAKMDPIITGAYLGAKNYDLSIARIEGKDFNLPYLVIKKPCKLELYRAILMCGYPGGGATLNITNKDTGMKTNPIIQKGMISSIMPGDLTNEPTGIITDIIATGGSSGSPIVDADDGELISVAQNVVATGVEIPLQNILRNVSFSGTAKIGLVFGVANFFLEPPTKVTLSYIKTLVDETGKPKEDFKRGEITRDIDMKGNIIPPKENTPKIDVLE